MADAEKSSSRLEKLARLKSLKSGLTGPRALSPETDDPLDAFLAEGRLDEKASAVEATAPKEAAPEDSEAESLSAYFEALGFKPKTEDELNVPKPAAVAVKPKPKPAAPARDLGDGDLWQDPVRTDAMMDTMAKGVEQTAPAAPVIEPEQRSAPDLEADDEAALDAFLRDIDPEAITEDIPATPPQSSLQDVADAADSPVDPFDPAEFAELEMDAALAAEIENATANPAKAAMSQTEAADDGTLSIVFDESRAKLLEHVSRQMNCSIDDVVVTAVDWYLDALFGEDGDVMQGNG